jgi:RNA polymerase-associated protein
MALLAKKSSMIFFSDPLDHYSHRVRIVLLEKSVTVDIKDIDPNAMPDILSDINPYNNLPTLIDRGLVLYEPNIMMEYLDERFPHPPLLPVYPVNRAKIRLLIHRIQNDWCKPVDIILNPKTKPTPAQRARKELIDSLSSVNSLFAEKEYFMSDDFTLLDCCMAPILWRLPALGIDIEKHAKSISAYADRLFERRSFKESLSELEKDVRD